MSAVLTAVADWPRDDSIDTTGARIPEPQGVPAAEPHGTEGHDGPLPDAGITREPPLTSPPLTSPPLTSPPLTGQPATTAVDDLSRGACGARIDPSVNQSLRAELSGFDDESELGDDDSPGGVNEDDDDPDEFDEIDEDDFDDEFDDDFEEELEDEYEIEIEDEISAEFGLGPDKDDEDEELDDLDSLADDLDEDIDDDLKD